MLGVTKVRKLQLGSVVVESVRLIKVQEEPEVEVTRIKAQEDLIVIDIEARIVWINYLVSHELVQDAERKPKEYG